MRYVYAVVVPLVYVGGLRLLLTLAGVVFLVAGALDVFVFRNPATGSAAALVGLLSLSCGYMFGLWLGDVVREVRLEEAPPSTRPGGGSPHRNDPPFGIMRPGEPQTRSLGS